MAKAIIGGQAIEVGLPNFLYLEAAWSAVQASAVAASPIDGVTAVLRVIAVGENATDRGEPPFSEAIEERVTALKRALKPKEMAGLRPFLNDLLVEVGLAKPPGEDEPVEEMKAESPSPATSEA